MMRPLTWTEFDAELASIRNSAWRLETQPFYAMQHEAADFERWRDGKPDSPWGIPWWRAWLDQVHAQTAAGKTVSRVRYLEDPPTPYQQWLVWAQPAYTEAGEDMRYVRRSVAEAAGLPSGIDFWLLDDTRVIVMEFSEPGLISRLTLITDPGEVARYRAWRDLAVRIATAAEEIPAA